MSKVTKEAVTLGPWTLPLTRDQATALAVWKAELIDKGRTFLEMTTSPGPSGEPATYTMTIPVNQPDVHIEHTARIAVTREK